MTEANHAVEDHYTPGDLIEAIRDGLRRAGKDVDNLAPADLAAIDEFHIRGRAASVELAERLGLDAETTVLDVGCGLGGASRLLAADYGCKVTGIDLTEAYCQAAGAIAQWVGLDRLTAYRQGDALDLPFADSAFEVAWTQHVAMNIRQKDLMYAEVRRVLEPGGLFAIYDVMQGRGGDIFFPVPWAGDPSISFLVEPDAARRLLTEAGFEIVSWRDTTAEGRAWFQKMAARLRTGAAPPLGFHLLLGPAFARMAENQRRNLEEDRIALIECVCRAA